MSNGSLEKAMEEALRNAKSLEELEALYRQIPQPSKKLYKVYEKRKFELKYAEYKKLKEELSQRKKKLKKEKVDIHVKIAKKWINSRLFTAEHYVALLQQSKDGLQLMFLRKAKLVENQGYLMLEVRKLRKAWVLQSEPILLEKSRIFFGKKFVAVHFVLPDFPYTLGIAVDEKLRQLAIKGVNGPQILHSVVRTKFFEALARVGTGPDYMMLIIGAVMGIGLGMAIGFGVSLFHLTSTPPAHTNTTTTTMNPFPTSTK
ncbi:B277 family protein [Sulfolobus sp. E11-6]|uniref:B277 family protein n=1 Tax=Sulfolobus sp. E11-6 TaxID=2663020 RepID=UPI001295C297|nr:B277 family protein [Sulfolobus sp. E11-6]QGA67432.1 hypothetical protein GFS33_00095 [Sulfolobus sp. E11-6]QGA87212.1 hypothetical protein [Sulfolobus spindle-shaped virus SSV19]